MKTPSKAGKPPGRVITELKRIAGEHDGILQPEIVVEEARPSASPLHSRFTWDNSEAAHQYRLWQARTLIRVTVETIAGIEGTVDVFVSLTTDRGNEGGGYRVMTTVLSDRQLKAQMLVDALNELGVFERKYSRLKELAAVFKAIRKVRNPRR